MARRPVRWLFTCEHASRAVPPAYAGAFGKAGPVLDSHRAWDPGAREVYRALAPVLADHALEGEATRLLVDLNRSLHHPRLFSEFTASLPEPERRAIVEAWWRPFREEAESVVAGWRSSGAFVAHVSVHSFTPVLDGVHRAADIGLLYDPGRPGERRLARAWRDRLAAAGWRVRLNYPYRGVADGHTTSLRRRHAHGYAGIELELNQALFAAGRDDARRLAADLAESLGELRREAARVSGAGA